MIGLRITLFGKLEVQQGDQLVVGLESRKVQELLCYLLLFRDRSHPREVLADLLWGELPTAKSKSYLRKVLWQLQTTLDAVPEASMNSVLLIEADHLQINPDFELWLDTAICEQAFALVQGVPGQELDRDQAEIVQKAVDLYRGDLLEGWYQSWCLYERERLQYMYLALLDKLMKYCEVHQQYQAGITNGIRALRYDNARERTHRRLMRLQYLAGFRTAALRQYDRCCAALERELGVKPNQRTQALYQQIRADSLESLAPEVTEISEEKIGGLPELLSHLEILNFMLTTTQRQIQQDIQRVKQAIIDRHWPGA